MRSVQLPRRRRVTVALAAALATIVVVGCSADPVPAFAPISLSEAAPSSPLAESGTKDPLPITVPTPSAPPGSASPSPGEVSGTPSSAPATVTNSAVSTAPTPAARAPTAGSALPSAGSALPSVGIAGVNDPQCRSDAPPVVLLHGTFSTVASSFGAMVPALRSSGRCVYAIGYGSNGTASVETSAAQVAAFVRTVLDVTGAGQVDVVGYSQGGLVLRTAVRDDGLAPSVGTAVLIAPSFHGTDSPLLGSLPGGLCPACEDQRAGSALLTRLAGGGDLDGDVRYTVISTTKDTVVTPLASQVPVGPPDRVRALVVQDWCPTDTVDHFRLPADPTVIAWTVAALDAQGRLDPDALRCS